MAVHRDGASPTWSGTGTGPHHRRMRPKFSGSMTGDAAEHSEAALGSREPRYARSIPTRALQAGLMDAWPLAAGVRRLGAAFSAYRRPPRGFGACRKPCSRGLVFFNGGREEHIASARAGQATWAQRRVATHWRRQRGEGRSRCHVAERAGADPRSLPRQVRQMWEYMCPCSWSRTQSFFKSEPLARRLFWRLA